MEQLAMCSHCTVQHISQGEAHVLAFDIYLFLFVLSLWVKWECNVRMAFKPNMVTVAIIFKRYHRPIEYGNDLENTDFFCTPKCCISQKLTSSSSFTFKKKKIVGWWICEPFKDRGSSLSSLAADSCPSWGLTLSLTQSFTSSAWSRKLADQI